MRSAMIMVCGEVMWAWNIHDGYFNHRSRMAKTYLRGADHLFDIENLPETVPYIPLIPKAY